jgi:hypothetical protein
LDGSRDKQYSNSAAGHVLVRTQVVLVVCQPIEKKGTLPAQLGPFAVWQQHTKKV